MIDLIDRLRSKTPNMTEGHAAMEEAAATIEALRARLAKADDLLNTIERGDPWAEIFVSAAAYRATGVQHDP